MLNYGVLLRRQKNKKNLKNMKFVYLTLILSCLSAPILECGAKDSVVYEYDAAGNRTARYIIAEEFDEQPGALRGALVTSEPQKESVVALGDLKMDLYPNPTNGPVTLDISGDTDQSIFVEIFSSVGVSLQSKAVTIGKNIIDLSSYPDGQYIVVLTSGANNSTSFKVIKGNF